MNKFQLLKNDLLKIEKEMETSKERDVILQMRTSKSNFLWLVA